MHRLNYAHLLYFHTVAREGSVVRASEVLHVTPQTISGQIKLLEGAIGEPLFVRAGRGLVLSDTGRLVQEYAETIFSLGEELTRRLGSSTGSTHAAALRVGVVDSIPKLVACRILRHALGDEDGAADGRLICHEGGLETLLAELAVHRLDLVLSDRPVPAGLAVKARNHPLGQSRVALFAPEPEVARLAAGFPASLDDAAILLPRENSALRRQLDHWFDERELHPRIVAEFDDGALMKAFGRAGLGVFPAPLAITEEIHLSCRARPIGTVDGVIESYVAISPERRLRHPVVKRVIERARLTLGSADSFGEDADAARKTDQAIAP